MDQRRDRRTGSRSSRANSNLERTRSNNQPARCLRGHAREGSSVSHSEAQLVRQRRSELPSAAASNKNANGELQRLLRARSLAPTCWRRSKNTCAHRGAMRRLDNRLIRGRHDACRSGATSKPRPGDKGRMHSNTHSHTHTHTDVLSRISVGRSRGPCGSTTTHI